MDILERVERKIKEGVPVSMAVLMDDIKSSMTYTKEKLPQLMKQVEKLNKIKDMAYEERNRLIAALSKFLPAFIVIDKQEPVKEWQTCVCIHSPEGQLTWHVHEDFLWMFKHLQKEEPHWDGHSTEEKYRRLGKLENVAGQ